MLTINLYYLNLLRSVTLRLRVVVLVRGAGGGGIGALLLIAPTTRRRFVGFILLERKVVRVCLFALS